MEIRTRSNVFSRRVIVLGLSGLAMLGVGVGACTAASGAEHQPAQHSSSQHLPHWLHWRYATAGETRSACGKTSKHGIVEWVGKGDSSWLVCPNGAGMEPS
jgi:hypothetical protein